MPMSRDQSVESSIGKSGLKACMYLGPVNSFLVALNSSSCSCYHSKTVFLLCRFEISAKILYKFAVQDLKVHIKPKELFSSVLLLGLGKIFIRSNLSSSGLKITLSVLVLIIEPLNIIFKAALNFFSDICTLLCLLVLKN